MSDNASASSSSSSSEIVMVVDPRYKFGKIYKIFCDIEGEDDIYVGSTVRELEVRLYHHFKDAEINTSTLHKFYNHMMRLGLDHFHIMIVEEYPCGNELVLRMREQHWMDELKPSLNTKRAFISADDYFASKKTKGKIYYAENKEAINARNKIYHAKNEEAIKAKLKIYRTENKVAINGKSHSYYHSRKVEIKVKADVRDKTNRKSGATHCGTCDKTFSSKSNLSQHKQSSGHKAKEIANLLTSESSSSSSSSSTTV